MGRVKNNQDTLIRIQSDVIEILKEQRKEIQELRRDTSRLASIQVDVVEMLRVQHEELQEMKRFNQQTRKLWVIIARKMDWLDEDLDIDSL